MGTYVLIINGRFKFPRIWSQLTYLNWTDGTSPALQMELAIQLTTRIND